MSEFYHSERTEFRAELAVECSVYKVAQKLQNFAGFIQNIAVSLALMAATASAKHFGVNIIKKSNIKK